MFSFSFRVAVIISRFGAFQPIQLRNGLTRRLPELPARMIDTAKAFLSPFWVALMANV